MTSPIRIIILTNISKKGYSQIFCCTVNISFSDFQFTSVENTRESFYFTRTFMLIYFDSIYMAINLHIVNQ